MRHHFLSEAYYATSSLLDSVRDTPPTLLPNHPVIQHVHRQNPATALI